MEWYDVLDCDKQKADEIVSKIKQFCKDNNFTFLGTIDCYYHSVRNKNISVSIIGPDCVEKYDKFLTELGLEHTYPIKEFYDGFSSYISI